MDTVEYLYWAIRTHHSPDVELCVYPPKNVTNWCNSVVVVAVVVVVVNAMVLCPNWVGGVDVVGRHVEERIGRC